MNTDTGEVYVDSPAISSDSEGNFVITWYAEQQIGDEEYKSYIIAQRFSKNGDPVGENFYVNTDTGDSSTAYSPAIASDANGNFIIVWEEYHRYMEERYIIAQRFSKYGDPIGENIYVHTHTGDTTYVDNPVIAADLGWKFCDFMGGTAGFVGRRFTFSCSAFFKRR